MANIAVAVKDILTGSFDWPMIALAWLVTAGATVWTTRAGARFLLSERLITASDRDVVEATGRAAVVRAACLALVRAALGGADHREWLH